jgi:hypothetical protein
MEPNPSQDHMNGTQLRKLVDAWIKGVASERDSKEFEENWWAIDKVLEMGSRDPASLWEFILAAYNEVTAHSVEQSFAAGPLEKLLSHYGADYIDRVEDLAKKDQQFNYLLGGVWRRNMSKDVWSRLKKVRRDVWPP